MDGGKVSFFDLIREFQNLGCKNQTKVALTCRVYVDLKDVVGVGSLDKFYDSDFDLIFLRGNSEDGANIYFPCSSCEEIDFKFIEKVQQKFCTDCTKSLTLCICDPASTILYYRLKKGWQQ